MNAAGDKFRLDGASIRIDAMPAAGRDLLLAPDAAERAVLAAALKISTVEALEVKLHALKFRGGIRVTGRLTAQITQPSVVSFDPVGQSLAEPIDRIFLPASKSPPEGAAHAAIFIDPDGDDIPDYFEGNEADLSELVFETIALAIDPYPRAPGESLGALGIDLDEADESPFAALARLKPKDDKGS